MKIFLNTIGITLCSMCCFAQSTSKEKEHQLEEITITTGYQRLNKERLNGSVVVVDSSLINRKVSTDILSRLEDIVPGLVFNKGKTATPTASGTNRLSIRGQNTIFSNSEPLIVIDNFPYYGDINNINPNDVKEITILKDAASSSIWGARSANGVIIITTRSGRVNQPLQVSFNSNTTFGGHTDLFYKSEMSSADYVDFEKKLFDKGFFRNAELSPNKTALTPVVELLIARQDNPISAPSFDEAIEALKSYDVRNDFDKYFYRNTLSSQHALSLSGGSTYQKYFLSAGYDRNQQELIGNGYKRFTLNASNSYTMLKGRLELTANINFAGSKTTQNNPGVSSVVMTSINTLYPYARLADDQGRPLSMAREYRLGYIQSVASLNQGLLDWTYKPLEDLGTLVNQNFNTDYRLSAGINYKIFSALSAQILYQYNRNLVNTRSLQDINNWNTRNQINRLTLVNPNGGLTLPIPSGGILDRKNQSMDSQYFRTQLNYARSLSANWSLNAILGYERNLEENISDQYRLYGYDTEHATSQVVNYTGEYVSYVNPASTTNRINNIDSQKELYDRNLSYYSNAGLTFMDRYSISASARLDRSNIFGVNINQKGVPLYSMGIGWQIHKESFYDLDWLSLLKLRGTLGYNGNLFKNLSAYTTAGYRDGIGTPTGLPFATVINPPNPNLRWEKVKTVNLGLDFSAFHSRISGSIDLYSKQGMDIIGVSSVPSSTGIVRFTGNTADTKGKGVEVILSTKNLQGKFVWQSDIVYGYNVDKVVKYEQKTSGANYVRADNLTLGVYPFEGRPLHAIYSYRWAGLDPENGDPRGYINGVLSKDYLKMALAVKPEDLVYNGPSKPVRFGSLRNTFSWKNLSLSASINYRLGYYFRRESVNYTTVFASNGGHGDYALAWKKPGDEAFTQVPSLAEVNNANRNNFYLYSSELVEKGDNVRLQDIQISYQLSKAQTANLLVKQIQFYLYANNLGVIWKAARFNLDSDYLTGTPPRTIAAGVKLNF